MGMEFPFGVVKVFQNWMVVVIAYTVKVLDVINGEFYVYSTPVKIVFIHSGIDA